MRNQLSDKRNQNQKSPFKPLYFYIIPALIAFIVYIFLVFFKGPITSEVYIPYTQDVSLRASEDKYLSELTELIFEQNRKDFQQMAEELAAVKEQLKDSISEFKEKMNEITQEAKNNMNVIAPAPESVDPNFADERIGAKIISHPRSFKFPGDTLKVMNVPLISFYREPELLIRHTDQSLNPSYCYSFQGPRGDIIVEFPKLVNVTQFIYTHLHSTFISDKLQQTQPRLIDIYLGPTMDNISLVHSAHLNLDENEVNFKLETPKPAKYAKLSVIANYGAEFTCLYRLKVLGKLKKFI